MSTRQIKKKNENEQQEERGERTENNEILAMILESQKRGMMETVKCLHGRKKRKKWNKEGKTIIVTAIIKTEQRQGFREI